MTDARNLGIRLPDLRRRELRRLLIASGAAHLGLVALMVTAPELRMATPPGVITVDLVAATAPAPRPAAQPRPPAPPKPPVPEKVVLPAQPREPEPTPKPKPKPESKPAPKPAPEPKPAPPQEHDYADVLADLRNAAGETAPQPDREPEAAGRPGSASGGGVVVSAEVASWMRRAKIHVKKSWVLPPGFRTQALEAHVVVELDAQGNVLGDPRVVRRSGNPWYDDGVVRALLKSSPLPAPPEADEWTFVFLPEDSY